MKSSFQAQEVLLQEFQVVQWQEKIEYYDESEFSMCYIERQYSYRIEDTGKTINLKLYVRCSIQLKGIFCHSGCIEEKTYEIEGEKPCRIHCEENGLCIDVQSNSLRSTQKYEFRMKCLAGCGFELPNDTDELVSALYVFCSLNEKAPTLQKPVKVRIQHCVTLESKSQAEYLSFVSVETVDIDKMQLKLNHLDGGKFAISGSLKNTGEIEIDLQKCFAVAIVKHVAPPSPKCASSLGSEDYMTFESDDDITGKYLKVFNCTKCVLK